METRDRLDVRVREGRLKGRKTRAVARALAQMHAQPLPAGAAATPGTPVALARRARAALESLPREARLAAAETARLRERQEEHLGPGIGRLLDRLEESRLRTLHGDLCCRHVWVDRCRRVLTTATGDVAPGDPAGDLAPLCADLGARGAAERAEQLVAEYVSLTDDFDLLAALDFHERVAGCELAARAAARGDGERARSLGLAAAAAGREPLLPPALVAFGGPVASGKSTLARKLARRRAAPRVVADAVRARLFERPLDPGTAESDRRQIEWQRALGDGLDDRLYAALESRAHAVLVSGRPVVMDACFPTRRSRTRAAKLAADRGVPYVFVECHFSEPLRRERLGRRDARDGRTPGSWLALAERLDADWEPPTRDEPGALVRLDTGRPSHECLAILTAALPGARRVGLARAESPA